MIQIVEQTHEEEVKMYMKCTKANLVEMLMNNQLHVKHLTKKVNQMQNPYNEHPSDSGYLHTSGPFAVNYYGLFKETNGNEFFARVIDSTGASWRIDDHDKSYFFAIPESFVRLATDDEIQEHINRPKL